MQFTIKLLDLEWDVVFVDPDSPMLEHEGKPAVALTRYYEQTIYMVNKLPKDIFWRVYTHEIVHALMYTHLLVIPESFTEEEVCNFIAQYIEEVNRCRNVLSEVLKLKEVL